MCLSRQRLSHIFTFCFVLRTRFILASYPICYDYKVSNRTLCPLRNWLGGFTSGYYPVCYQTVMWKEYSPPPTCRETGCNDDSSSACCCGADPTLVSADLLLLALVTSFPIIPIHPNYPRPFLHSIPTRYTTRKLATSTRRLLEPRATAAPTR